MTERTKPESSDVCQHRPCDCCEVFCDAAATVTLDGIGRFCDAHAKEYQHDD
jgi:hypothetical protein